MANIVMTDYRVRIDFTQLPNLYSLGFGGTITVASATTIVKQFGPVYNPDYDPTKPLDTYYGNPTLSPYAVYYGTFNYTVSGINFSTSTLTGFQLGYQQSGVIYGVNSFIMSGTQFYNYAISNNGLGLINTVFGGQNTAQLFGTGSSFNGGNLGNDISYLATSSNYTIRVTFGSYSATVLAKGFAHADTLSNVSKLIFPDTTLTFLSGSVFNVAKTSAANLTFGTLLPGNVLNVPLTSGSMTLQLDPFVNYANSKIVIAPDGTGGSRVTQFAQVAPGMVFAAVAGGSAFVISFDAPGRATAPQSALDLVNTALFAGIASATTAQPGISIPAPVPGTTGELILHSGGAYVVPANYAAVLVDAVSRVTISGGSASGQLVIAGTGGLAFNAGGGAGSVFAGGGGNLVSMYPGAGNQTIDLGAGNDTVIALAGNNVIVAGGGSNQILLGSGANQVVSTGTDLIAGGSGTATISTGANAVTTFLGSGASRYIGGNGNATVVSTTGVDTISSAGNAQLWLGSNIGIVTSTGADTVIGGTGAATVNAIAGNMFVFAGSGALDFRGGSGVSTVLGSANGTATINGGSGAVIALANATLRFIGGTGAATIAAFAAGSALTITGGAGPGIYVGGPAGANSITGGSGRSTIYGGGSGDVLSAGTGGGDVIKAGIGAATISATDTNGSHALVGGSGPNVILTGNGSANVQVGTGATTIISGSGLDAFHFTAGNGNNVVIQAFTPGLDFINLLGFPTGEAINAISNHSTIAAGSQTIDLSDGTHITFQGFTGLSAGTNFI